MRGRGWFLFCFVYCLVSKVLDTLLMFFVLHTHYPDDLLFLSPLLCFVINFVVTDYQRGFITVSGFDV